MSDSTEATGSDTEPASKPTKKKAVKKKPASRIRPPEWVFPRNCLEESIHVAQAIEDKHGGNPMDAPMLAKAVGFKNPDWRFTNLLHSANLYGLVSGSGAKATVALEPIGQDIVAPDSPAQRQSALLRAFHNVPLFKDVADFYGGKQIPEDEFFSNTLTRKFNIPRDRVDTFIEVFTRDRDFLRGFDVSASPESRQTSTSGADGVERKESSMSRSRPVRQFLDTCFVMMPFGHWYDRYYKEVYVPAIKEAGFEPVRADGLFSTGTVIEQIWQQIIKSKVLLGDLSDKNANVFYELGLAHAACKPVVLTASSVEDIPFDLRHLRAIIYEIREPNWATTLQERITAYLKNARAEPERSIPQPFRDHLKSESIADSEDADFDVSES